jgi:hypothetical protein
MYCKPDANGNSRGTMGVILALVI